MAEDSMDDYNPMQLRLGLSPSGGSFNPVGSPTQPFMPPGVMHPGQAAMNIVNQTQTAAAHTMQSAQSIQASMPPAYNSFAQQYQSNMSAIQSNYQNPFYAQALGGGGFNPGMMPMPSQMTSPGMGIFRPFSQGMTSSIPPVPQLPFFRGPFTPTLPGPHFSSPYEYAYGLQQQRMDQYAAGGLALTGTAAHFGATAFGGYVGRGLGALVGARLGGVPGAMFGATAGAIGGMFGSEMSGFSSGVQGLVDNMNPLRMPFMRGAQMQGASTNFVTSGADLNTVGLGLNRGASLRLGNMLSTMGGNRDFQNATGNQFSTSDLLRITQGAGQNGLLDASQSPEQIRDSVKNIAKSLRLFMQIAHEPDVKEALRMMGQARNMGLSLGEHGGMMNEARMFSRMARTNIGGLAETGGLPGAMTFQQGGLTAGLGMRMGQGMLGLAQQSVAGGAYSAQAYGLLGNTQGIAQRDTESALALLKMPMITAAMAQYSGGQFGLHSGNVNGLASGQFSIGQMANMGVNNLQAAQARGGIGALGTFLMQQPELQDSLGRQLGPMGMKAMEMNIVRDYMNTLGVKGADGFNMAAMALKGGDANAARQLRDQASSPAFFTGMRQQLEIQRNETRTNDEDYHNRTRLGMFNRGMRDTGLAGYRNNLIAGINQGIEAIGDDFNRLGDVGSGDTMHVRINRSLLASSPIETAALSGKVSANFMSKLATTPSSNYDQAFALSRAMGGNYITSAVGASNRSNPDSLLYNAETNLRDKIRGGARLQYGLTATDDEQNSSRKALGANSQVASLFAVALGAKAKELAGRFGGNFRMGDTDIKGVLNDMRTAGQIDGLQYNELIKDDNLDNLVTASAYEASQYAGPEGRLALKSVAPELAGLGTKSENEKYAKSEMQGIQRELSDGTVGGMSDMGSRVGGGIGTLLSSLSGGSLGAMAGALGVEGGIIGGDTTGRYQNLEKAQKSLMTLTSADPTGQAAALAGLTASGSSVPGAAAKASALRAKLMGMGQKGVALVKLADSAAVELEGNPEIKHVGSALAKSSNAAQTASGWGQGTVDAMNRVPRGMAISEFEAQGIHVDADDPRVIARAQSLSADNTFNMNVGDNEKSTNKNAADFADLQDTMAKTFPEAVAEMLRAATRQNSALDRQGVP